MKNKGKIILGIESTAHTFGIGIVKNGKIIANKNKIYTTEQGGIIPTESAKHHCENKHEIYAEALDKVGIDEKDIDAVAFSQGPGLAPCLLEGMRFAKELAGKLKKPVVPVNHCIAHLEVGRLTKTRDPVMLYVSGANTQIIAYASGKYRIFGETLDIGVGNFIDNFARYAGIGFPGGPAIEKLALQGKKYIELPYTAKGMDITLSGILTNLRQKLEKMNLHSLNTCDTENKSKLPSLDGRQLQSNCLCFLSQKLSNKLSTLDGSKTQRVFGIDNSETAFGQVSSLKNNVNADNSIISSKKLPAHSHSQINKNNLIKNTYNHSIELVSNNSKNKYNNDKINDKGISLIDKKHNRAEGEVNYTLQDLCYSMQETVFAMLVECAERALAHTEKKELLLGGGVACNSRLQEMCRIMCKERGAKLFVPENEFLQDNAAMIAYTGELMFKNGDFVKVKDIDRVDIKPRQRTDDVEVLWR